MKAIKVMFSLIISMLLSYFLCTSQNKVDKYWEFIEQNPNYSVEKFYNDHPVGMFIKDVPVVMQQIEYLDSVSEKYGLTDTELELLTEHNFVVTERKNYRYFYKAMDDIWQKDLPLFVTSDLILDAFHMSYDVILRNIERYILIPKLNKLLTNMHNALPIYASQNPALPEMQEKINDIDVYLTVARNLLKDSTYTPVFDDNIEEINKILEMIEGEKPLSYPLFSSTPKKLDFSQFTPRGHYTLSKDLKAYFKSMIWLGRTELYLIAPVEPDAGEPKQKPEDIQRQIIDATIIYQLITKNNLIDEYETIDKIIESMVGISDNVQLHHIGELMLEANINDPAELLNMDKVELFQEILSTKEYSEQKILSQILMSNPFVKEQIKPASAFLLLGQRFLIDSYVCANVVYDRIIYDDMKMRRMLPSVYDVLFTLGNDPASEFLKNGLEEYKYSKNLAALRLLIDSYGENYWENSIYNLWLNAIRKLNTPNGSIRQVLPKLMQTAAWWQKSMNTQLASWAQLRHDNILYGKQSYTGGVSCSYPHIFVEPVPDFFKAMSKLCRRSYDLLKPYIEDEDIKDHWYISRIKDYLLNFDTLCTYFETIAEKEITGTALTDEESEFLNNAYYLFTPCGGGGELGWMRDLYLQDPFDFDQYHVVADIHTAPSDEFGSPVGWVKHVGTGPVNLGIFIVNNWDGNPTAYCGPVLSFYEYTSLNFKRLNDDEWIDNFRNNNTLMCSRLDIVDLYSTDTNGLAKNTNPVSLPTVLSDVNEQINNINFNISTFPNPFIENIYINFKIPNDYSDENVNVQIFDSEGKIVMELFNNILQSGNYSIVWDGTDFNNNQVSNGTYLCRISVGNESQTAKLILAR
ncbi:DUF3160 domain-containing protein [Bacteroidota bacterium]